MLPIELGYFRKFNNAGKHKNSKTYPLPDLIKDLQTIPTSQEFSADLILTPTNSTINNNTTAEITHIIKQHKKYTKNIVAAAKKENTLKYSKYLEALFEQKPKKALDAIISTHKNTDKNQRPHPRQRRTIRQIIHTGGRLPSSNNS